MKTTRSCLLLSFAALCAACSNGGSAAEREGTAVSSSADLLTRPSGPVLDAANLLPDVDEARLSERLRGFYDRTGHALVVVTTPSLGGEDIADYTRKLANRWGVGDAKRNDGAVLLVAPRERKVRIAIGTGMTKQVPDALCARIISERITPRFKRGEMVAGIEAGADALTEAMQ
jgi:uncharacterized protein